MRERMTLLLTVVAKSAIVARFWQIY